MGSSSKTNLHPELAEMEKIITEFFAKALHIILESRSPCLSRRNSSSLSVNKRDKWFNLALRECPEALENFDLFHQNNLQPMFIDVVLATKPIKKLSLKERFSNYRNYGQDNGEKIIERWVVEYETRKSRDSNSSSSLRGKRNGGSDSHSLYKKSIILLRSLYLTVKILPAYKLFRDLNLSNQINTFCLVHRVSSFVEPLTHREEAEMKRFGFTPVDTSCCRLRLSVSYQPTLLDVRLEPLIPMSTQFVSDYVGSPTIYPLLRFLSLPLVPHGSENHPFPLLPNNNDPSLSPRSGSRMGGSIHNARALKRFGDTQSDATTQKMNSLEKDEIGNLSRAKISAKSSARISRVVDDDDIWDPLTRSQSFDGKGQFNEPIERGRLPLRQSQNAAIGSLVHMLQTAPPLCQSSSNLNESPPQISKPETRNKSIIDPDVSSTSSRFLTLKTTAKALEELGSYREMKDLLLKQGRGS